MRYPPIGVLPQLRAPFDITMLPWHMVHMASVAPPPGPTCFRTDFASILEASDLKISGSRAEGVANPAYRPLGLQAPPRSSKTLPKRPPGRSIGAPRRPRALSESSQELPRDAPERAQAPLKSLNLAFEHSRLLRGASEVPPCSFLRCCHGPLFSYFFD